MKSQTLHVNVSGRIGCPLWGCQTTRMPKYAEPSSPGPFTWTLLLVNVFYWQRQDLLRASSITWTGPRSASFKMRDVDACPRARMSARVHACAPTRPEQPNPTPRNPTHPQSNPAPTRPHPTRPDTTQPKPIPSDPIRLNSGQPNRIQSALSRQPAIRGGVPFPRRAEFCGCTRIRTSDSRLRRENLKLKT